MTAAVRKLVVLAMCAAFLLPVLSTADDVALLSPVLGGYPPTETGTLADRPSVNGAILDVTFWALFDFLQCPDPFHFAPHMGFTGTVTKPEPGLRSVSAPRASGRSPPAYS